MPFLAFINGQSIEVDRERINLIRIRNEYYNYSSKVIGLIESFECFFLK